MRLAAATKWYEIGRVSQSKAAEIAGISHQAFIEALPRFKVTSLQTTPEELAREWAEAQQPTQLARNQIAGQDFIKKARGMLKGTSSLTQALLKARAEEREQEESNLPFEGQIEGGLKTETRA